MNFFQFHEPETWLLQAQDRLFEPDSRLLAWGFMFAQKSRDVTEWKIINLIQITRKRSSEVFSPNNHLPARDFVPARSVNVISVIIVYEAIKNMTSQYHHHSIIVRLVINWTIPPRASKLFEIEIWAKMSDIFSSRFDDLWNILKCHELRIKVT